LVSRLVTSFEGNIIFLAIGVEAKEASFDP